MKTPLVFGVLLILFSVVLGLWLLPVRSAPSAEPASIGLVPPDKPRAKRGFSVSTAVFVADCGNPVDVIVVANGTAEYWRDRARDFPRNTTFRVALPGTNLRDLRLGLSARPLDTQFPMHAVARASRFLTAHRIRKRAETTVVSGTVRDWTRHLNAVVVTFKANWLDRRALGSCYLSLPAITGGLSVLAAQVARGQASRNVNEVVGPDRLVIESSRTGLVARYDRSLETTLGSTTVVARNSEVVGDASLPGPDLTSEGHATWTCETTPPTTGSRTGARRATPDVLLAPLNGGAYSRAYLRQAVGSDCSSLAVVVENDAGTWRDLVILLLGATLSLGAALSVEFAIARRSQAST